MRLPQASPTPQTPSLFPICIADSLYNVLADMLFELKDGHVNLSTLNNRNRNWKWYTGFSSNYNLEFVEIK